MEVGLKGWVQMSHDVLPGFMCFMDEPLKIQFGILKNKIRIPILFFIDAKCVPYDVLNNFMFCKNV